MQGFELLTEGLRHCMTPGVFMLMLMGVGVGIVFGSIPGLSAMMAVALFLPVTFTMDPRTGMTLLIALYIGATSGGLIAAILLNIPGTPSSIATCFDGSPMAKRGEAGKALGVGIVYSFLGGLFSFIILMFLAPPIAKFALRFSAIEYFAVTFFALAMIATLSSGNFLIGLLSGMLGLIVSTVGQAPIEGLPRFTFGNDNLISGFDTLPTLIGIFAISEALSTAESIDATKDMKTIELKPIKGFGFSLAEFKSQTVNFFRSCLIGTGVGILPGIGGSMSGILSYVVAKNQSKYPEKFGTGVIDGIVAPETANNATIGGALIPLLALGIPGDGVTAMMLGGFMIHGLTPGPLLFTTSADLVYTIFAACIIANFIMIAMEFFGIRIFVKMLLIPKYILMPIILVMCTVGSYAVANRAFDCQSIIFFGIIGYLMSKLKMPVAPFILAFILGGNAETYFRRGLMMTDGSIMPFITRPISAILIGVTFIVMIGSVVKEWKRYRAGRFGTGEVPE